MNARGAEFGRPHNGVQRRSPRRGAPTRDRNQMNEPGTEPRLREPDSFLRILVILRLLVIRLF